MNSLGLEIAKVQGYPCLLKDFVKGNNHMLYIFCSGVFIVNKDRSQEFKVLMEALDRLSNRKLLKSKEQDNETMNKYKFLNCNMFVHICEVLQ